MAKVIYLSDRKKGLHCYTPEMGDRKPYIEMTANIGHYGDYFVTTKHELKGRGISLSYVRDNGEKVYRCTDLAFSKLEAQYPIKMECLLD